MKYYVDEHFRERELSSEIKFYFLTIYGGKRNVEQYNMSLKLKKSYYIL